MSTATGPIPSCASASSTSIRAPAGTAASSTSTTSPACARRIRRCSRRPIGWRSPWCVTASSTRYGSTIPTAWPTRRPTSVVCATGGRIRCGSRRSLSPRRAAAGLGGHRHRRLRVSQRRLRGVRRQRSRGGVHGVVAGAIRGRPGFPGGRRRGQAGAGDGSVFAGDGAAGERAGGGWRYRRAGARCGLVPDLSHLCPAPRRRRGAGGPRRRGRRRPAGRAGGDAAAGAPRRSSSS